MAKKAKRLTDKFIKRRPKSTLKQGDGKRKGEPIPYRVWDSLVSGLGLTVSPEGKKTWFLQAVYPGPNRFQARKEIGKFPAMKVADARARATRWLGWLHEGKHPEEEEADERRNEALKRSHTFASVAKDYIAGRSAKRRTPVDEREIDRMLVPAIGERPIAKIEAREVRQLIGQLIRQRGPYIAENAFDHLRGIFKFGLSKEVLAVNPMKSIDKSDLFQDLTPARDRSLEEVEAAAYWRAAAKLKYPYGDLFQFLLLTGTRISEAAKARWEEFHPDLRKTLRDAAKAKKPVNWAAFAPDTTMPATTFTPGGVRLVSPARCWTIPKERFKSNRVHVVPLSDEALAILERLPRMGGGDFLFSTTGEKPVNGLSKAKSRLDRFMLWRLKALARTRGDDPEQVKLAPFVLHDTRRTVRTTLSQLKIPPHVGEAVLGHTIAGLQAVYDKYDYLAEKREALDRWAARLRDIASPVPKKVIRFNERKARR